MSDPTYPVLARSLRVRRENIGATIVSLENLRAPKASALDTTEREVGVGDELREHQARGVFSH